MGISFGVIALAIWLIIKNQLKVNKKQKKVTLPFSSYQKNRDYLQDLACDITIENGLYLDSKLHLFKTIYRGNPLLEFDVDWITSIAIIQLKKKPKIDSSSIRVIPAQLN